MKKVFTATILALIGAAVWFVTTLDDRIRTHIEKTATRLAGVPVAVESVELSLVSGKAAITGITVNNPPGYTIENAFEMGLISVEVDMTSVLSQPLVISSMVIDSTALNLELKDGRNSNLQDIVNVSRKQNGNFDKKKDKKSDSTVTESSNAENTVVTESASTTMDAGESSTGEPDSAYRMRIEKLVINETTFTASQDDTQWSDTVSEIDLDNVGGEEGLSTRGVGITIVTVLARKALKQAASKRLQQEVKKQLDEKGSDLLKSLLN